MKTALEILYDWLLDENREPARTKFTSGTLRNVASEIEFLISKQKQERLLQDMMKADEESELYKTKCVCGKEFLSIESAVEGCKKCESDINTI